MNMLLLAAIKPQKKNTITKVAKAPVLVFIPPADGAADNVADWLIAKVKMVNNLAA